MRRLAFLLGAACSLAACADVEVPPFPAGQGQEAHPATYPPGPYGVSKGQTISNYEFVGFHQPWASADPNGAQPIALGDFYNPGGAEVFPAGSPYGEGTPKPKVLMIDVSASWCGPCQVEARNTLPPAYAKYHPMGAEFFLVLGEGEPTIPATTDDLKTWVTKFKTEYPSVIDGSPRLPFGTAFPIHILIDTRTMVIVDVVNSKLELSDPFFAELEQALAD